MHKEVPISESSKQLRTKAEQFLQLKLRKNPSKHLQGDYLKLVHELEVHELELEMQNQELLEAIEKIGDVNHRYSDLYNFAPAGYFTLTREGNIIGLNQYGAQLLGINKEFLLGKRLDEYVSTETSAIFIHFFDNIWNNKCNETCEITLVSTEHGSLDVIVKGQLAENEDHCLI
jgi:PAS domain-containing protein